MDKSSAQRIVRDTFKAPFEKKRFRDFINELCNGFDESKGLSSQQIPDAFKPHVKSCQRLGTFEASDGELADILIVHLTESFKLERTRTALRDFVAHKLKRGEGEDNSYKEAGLAAFVAPDSQSWRFSYVRMEYATKRDPKTGKIKPEERLTPARRYSYLVGEAEECHTAQSRFLALLQNTTDKPALSQIEEAFSVESVTKEFFNQYAALFKSTQEALDVLVAKDKAVRADFQAKRVSSVDFAKKLLGQIVFLYFIQKKGWLGVPKGGKWGEGRKDFMRWLADKAAKEGKCLFNDLFEPLFYDTLATDRRHEAWCSRFQCRIPFLNGGLFEPLAGYDWRNTNLAFPNSLFTNSEITKEGDKGTGILDVFDRYNFTVNEAEPLEKEVAIDPEMLGKVFENLIEDNRRKGLGAFYTPREIVHYMCQESLINYLDAALNTRSEPIHEGKRKQAPLFGDVKAEQTLLTASEREERIPRADIEKLIREGEQASHYETARKEGTISYTRKLPKTVETHARALDEALKAITVCDPAIGSGAFPMGMMTEIVRARSTLTPYFNDVAERTAYHFKRHAIQNSIYGVDIDAGAVEIAKLRLWLSLVVDEEDVQQIKPLPNLDYKVVAGNSLLGVEKDLFNLDAYNKLERLKPQYFDESDREKKARLKEKIDGLIHELTNGKEAFDFEIYFSEVFHAKTGFDVVIGNPPYIQLQGDQGALATKYQNNGFETFARMGDIYVLFYERGRQLLRDGGHLCYITSNKWMRAGYGEKLRAFLATKTQPKILIDFAGQKIFESATVDTNILLFERKADTHTSPTLACIATENCRENMSVFVEQHAMAQSFKGADSWVILSPIEKSIKEKIERIGIPLRNWDISINYGIKTGFNDAFIIDETKRAEILANCKDSAERKRTVEIIRPILRGRDIKRYGYTWAGLHLIAAHNGIPEKGVPRIDIKNYPAIKAHFDSYWEQLKSRADQGDTPYNLRSCAYMEDFSKPKIMWAETMRIRRENNERFPRFSYSPESIFTDKTCFMAVGDDLKLALAFLNSMVGRYQFSQTVAMMDNGGYLMQKIYVEQVRIGKVNVKMKARLVSLVEKLLNTETIISNEEAENEIDALVFDVFRISSSEQSFLKEALTTPLERG